MNNRQNFVKSNLQNGVIFHRLSKATIKLYSRSFFVKKKFFLLSKCWKLFFFAS